MLIPVLRFDDYFQLLTISNNQLRYNIKQLQNKSSPSFNQTILK